MSKMKIAITSYGQTHSTEMSDESTVDEVVRVFVNLMVACGYSEENLIELFKDGDPRKWDSAWSDTDEVCQSRKGCCN